MEKKVPNQFSCEPSKKMKYLERAVGMGFSLSFVIRTLLAMWYHGKIELEFGLED